MVFLGAAAAALPVAARAQNTERIKRVVLLQPQLDTDHEARAWIAAFRTRLKELGWTEDVLRIEYRSYGGDLDRLRENVAALASARPDIVVGMSTPTVAALKQAGESTPIVFVNANDPVGSGFVASLARPGGNITGVVAFEPSIGGKWLETLREIAPEVTRVALLYNPKTHTGQHFEMIEIAARAFSVNLEHVQFDDEAGIERGLGSFARAPKGGLLVLPDASSRVHRDLIVRLAAEHRLPAVYSYRLFVTEGGLASYGTSTEEQFRKAAIYVDQLLRGAKPSELPVQAPTKFDLVVNLKTARALGLTLSPSLLARADELIE